MQHAKRTRGVHNICRERSQVAGRPISNVVWPQMTDAERAAALAADDLR